MGGDLRKIRLVGQYMIEIWKAIGMNMQNVRFLWASDEVDLQSTPTFIPILFVTLTSRSIGVRMSTGRW